jgi:uncharacterized membrane protein YeaQ/YmgE (transglycosylase-associated protein family)
MPRVQTSIAGRTVRVCGRAAGGVAIQVQQAEESMDYAFLSQPGVGLFTMLIIGLIAGWIAEKVTSSDHGLIMNLIVGIAGAFIGGKLAEVLEIPVFGFWRTLGAAAVGAIILLFIVRAVRRR